MKGLYALVLLTICCHVQAGIKKEAITFKSGTLTLSGTVLIPKGSGPFPAVVFLHGSGPDTRDQNRWRAKKFTRQGYVSLIFDKRGTGFSQGSEQDWRYFSFDSLAQDAIAAVDYLHSRQEVDPTQIGLIAASQSGWVAPIASTKSNRISFMVIISGSVSTVAEDRIFERGERLKREGFNEVDRSEVKEMQNLDHAVTRDHSRFPEFQSLWRKYESRAWFPRVYPSEYFLQAPEENAYRQWFKRVIDFDPLPIIASLEVPTLWLYGDPELDRFGPVKESVRRIDQLITTGKPFLLKQYDGADHNLNGSDYFEDIFEWLERINI